jgi:hypothetical protein
MNTPATTIGGGDTAEQLSNQFGIAIKHIDAIVVGATADGSQFGAALFPALKAACLFVQQVSNGLYPDIVNADGTGDVLEASRFPVTDEDRRRIQEGDEASLRKLRAEERRVRIQGGDFSRYPRTEEEKKLVEEGDANALRILQEDKDYWKSVEEKQEFCENLGYTKPPVPTQLPADESDDPKIELDFEGKKKSKIKDEMGDDYDPDPTYGVPPDVGHGKDHKKK